MKDEEYTSKSEDEQKKIKRAIKNMLKEAKAAAMGKAECMSYADVFGEKVVDNKIVKIV